jgi:type IV pilus assembly protein PilQ
MMRLWTGNPLRRASERWTRALACGVGAVLLAGASPANDDGAVISLSVVPTGGRAQVVIGVDGAVSIRDFVLRNPDRIVVDITGAKLAVKKGGYDRIARGGVLDVRYAQNQANVVRIVLTVDGPRSYEVVHSAGSVSISVDGGGAFATWRVGRPPFSSPALVKPATHRAMRTPAPAQPASPVRATVATATVTQVSAPTMHLTATDGRPTVYVPQAQQRQQPRITIAWERADIRDVLAAFAAFSGRTILPAKGVEGTVTAEIIDKPWDVAMRAILNANGYDAVEDENGIIIVNTLEALARRPSFEPLATRTLRLNYVPPGAIAEALRSRLSRDCGTQQQTPAGTTTPTAPVMGSTGPLNCPVRGAVTADSLSNSISITDAASTIDDLVSYAQSLDIRQPQVNIKAKIILVDRTNLEGLGLKYDIGTRNHHFNELVPRLDSLGQPEDANIFTLGGNTLAAIANAAQSVPNAALKMVYSVALGGYDFTVFLEALQEISLLDVQAEPSVTTLNYRPAVLSAGTQVPVRTIEQGTGGNAGGAFPQVTVTFRQTGIVLRVTPSITNNRQIKMVVHAENSEVDFRPDGAVFPTQSIDNELLVADGETAVMGGLTQTSVRITKSGIPLLVDLPLLGRLFGVTNREETKRDLLILITPHIVDDGDMAMEPRRQP